MPKFYTTNKILPNSFVKPKIDKTQYKKGDGMLGGQEILMPGGHGWLPYIPQLERQNEFFETYHCTVFNTLNPIEALAKLKWNEDWNKSERYNGVLAGLSNYGGSPHNVAESIRKYGVIEQSSLPWTSDITSFWEYSRPRPMTQEYLDEGRRWLRSYTFSHDWVITAGKSNLSQAVRQAGEFFFFISTPEAIKDALQYSPLGISVLAWKFDSDGKAYKNRYETDNHWTVLYDYIEGDCWLVYDSYLKAHVKLRWDYPIAFAKRYFLDKASFAEADAQHIIDNMDKTCVKGDLKARIYFIFNGAKMPFPTMLDFEQVANKYWGGNKSFKVVAQDALDLVPEGLPMVYENILKITPLPGLDINNNHT